MYLEKECQFMVSADANIETSELEPITQTFQVENSKTERCKRSIEMNYGCSVCGEDEWCGTDGCPLDPQ